MSWTAVRGVPTPVMAPMEQSVRATTLTVIWNCRNRRMLSYTDLPAPARRTLARRPEGGGGSPPRCRAPRGRGCARRSPASQVRGPIWTAGFRVLRFGVFSAPACVERGRVLGVVVYHWRRLFGVGAAEHPVAAGARAAARLLRAASCSRPGSVMQYRPAAAPRAEPSA